MLNLLNIFRKEKLWDFQGGIHPPEMKTQSNGTPLSQLPLPDRFIIPLKQHIGHEGEICVAPGDRVLRGQPLTFGNGRMLPVHAPTSGTIDAIAQHMTAHPSGLSELCIFMSPDGEDRWTTLEPMADYRQRQRADIVQRIHDAGVAGLGGAGFPTGTKLRGGLRGVKTLIINAAECEPYITADDRLMQDYAAEVLEGSRILAWVLQAERVLIGIEDNKPEAIAALKRALGGERDLHIRVIPTKYPSGGAKQLTKILTGLEVPHGGRSTDIGVLMQNVGTAWAVKRAVINGEPLTERVVTLTGEAIAQPRNVWSRIGTPISHLLHQVGFTPAPRQMVIMGGPLMGFTLPSLDVPVVKITNCILAPSASEMGNNDEEQSCIRCSACADACPAKLLPQQLYWYSQGGDHDKARAHHIDDCIECGACAYVCPSNIPLVQYYRQEKAELRAIDLEAKRTAEAKARFEARQARLEREKLAREAKHELAKQRVARSDEGELAAARERVMAKRQAAGEVDPAVEEAQRQARHAQAHLRQAEAQSETQALSRQAEDPRKAAVEAAIARAKAKKTTQPEAAEEAKTEAADPRKAAVEAAIARAKAKKAAAVQTEETPPNEDAASVDPRKAAVEAAIARAKAKKAATAQATADTPTEETQPVEEAPSVDPRKAAVEAAIARAKAKKAAAQATADAPTEETQSVEDAPSVETASPVDPRKAAVEAAIARAKAKKAAAAQATAATPTEETQPVEDAPSVETASPVDPRKAAVEAAIARAKAKKAAAAQATADAQAEETQPVEHAPSVETASPVDPRKAAVEAAIARAKAKKAEAAQAAAGTLTEEVLPVEDTPPVDPRKAAVEAAIARAKAKKAAAQGSEKDVVNLDVENSDARPSEDARKAAVAAAIARAKARKAQTPSTFEE